MSRRADPDLFFVTGAPRSGTTFVSDWVCEDPDTYCVHEVWDAGEEIGVAELLARLHAFADTGADRLGKPLQRQFLRWPEHHPRATLRRLGLKEPVTWTLDPPQLPYPLAPLFDAAPLIVLLRHPYDVVASGRARDRTTTNWPGFSVAEHCDFWARSAQLVDATRAADHPVLAVAWEELVLDPDGARRALETFLGVHLGPFGGFELDPERLAELRRQADRRHGLRSSPTRELLSDADRRLIRSLVGEHCASIGYEL